VTAATLAQTPPRVPRTGLPVSFLVDYDGTISILDVGDELLRRHGPDAAKTAAQDAAYDAGRVGSRALMRWDMDVLPDDPRLLRDEAGAAPQDEGFSCKRERVRAHQALGRVVVFVGDGTSDRYAAFHADIVLAKGALAGFCEAAGWPFRRWADFTEVTAWLAAAVEEGSLPRRRADVPGWRAGHPSMAARGAPSYICGPEAWGPGRTVPADRP
jgi:hypothetical protein